MDEQNTASTNDRYGRTVALLFSVFAIATCGLIYELLAGTIASYMLGDSVTQFSTIIGVYLFSMGLGSYLSRYFRRDLIAVFIQIEILVGLVGGLSSFVLFVAFSQVDSFRVVLYSWVTVIGILVGLEIPFVLRILKDQFPFSDLISKVLSLDYLGGLVASLLFPLWLVPQVGLMRSSFVFGVLNLLVAIWTCHLFREQHRRPMLTVQAYFVLVLLLKRFSNRPCTTWGGRGTSAHTDAGGPMRAYSMDLRERALLDSDAGMKAADVAAKYRVSGSWVRLLKQRRRETGEVAPRVQRQGRRGMLEPHLHTLAALIAAHPDLACPPGRVDAVIVCLWRPEPPRGDLDVSPVS